MKQPNSFAKLRTLSITLLFITGACGLIYEVTWHRYLANLVGSEARAAALILAVFLGGLALGYHIFGKVSQNKTAKELLKITGWLEIGIGCWTFFFPSLYNWMWKFVDVWSKHELIGGLTNALLLILFPTILMGGTLPLLTQALSVNLEEVGKIHAKIYSANTLGAFFGCLIAGFFLLPALGLPLTLMYTSLFNLAAGLAFFLLSSSAPDEAVETIKNEKADLARTPLFFTSLIAFICGFVAITLQAAVVRLIGFSAGSSEYAFAMVVAVFVFLLALGSFRVAKNPSSRFNVLWLNQLIVVLGLVALYWSVPSWPYWSHLLRILFTSVAPSFYIYHVSLFLGLALILFLPIHAMGRSMPLLFALVTRHLNQAGKNVGAVYFLNTLGCVFGAIIGGYLLFFRFNLDQIFKLCTILITFTIPLALYLNERTHWLKPILIFLPISIAAFLLPNWDTTHLQVGSFRLRQATPHSYEGEDAFYKNLNNGDTLAYHRDGPTSTIGIVESHARGLSRSIIVNGKSDGNTIGNDLKTVNLVGQLPSLLTTAKLDKVAVIGFGTGITAGSLSLYPEVKEVHVFEISPLVNEYAHLFDFANHELSKSIKIRWHLGDAYQKILADHEKYSIICSEPSNPWVTGVERLYSQEFLELAKQRLKKGGIYSQWFHLYDISPDTFKLVLNTFRNVFPFVRIFQVESDVILLGSVDEPGLENLKQLEQKWQLPAVHGVLEKIGINSIEQLLSLQVLIPTEWSRDSGVHTLLLPKLAFRAGFDFFTGASTPLNKLENEFLNRMWMRKYLRSGFSALWLQLHSDKKTLSEIVTKGCGQPKLAFFSQWNDVKETLRSCRIGLAKAVVEGLLPNQNAFSPSELTALTQISRGETSSSFIKTVVRPAEIQKFASFLMDYDSAFFPVRSSDALELSKGCFGRQSEEYLKCQSTMVEVLAYFGEIQEAERIFSGLLALPQVPEAEKRKMEEWLTEAERVNS